MDVGKMKILLNELDIHIVEEDSIIYHDNSYHENFPLENHYAIRVNENNYWEICFVQLERRNSPEYKQIKEFDSKDEALVYFFLDRLRDYFIINEVRKNIDFKTRNWSQELLSLKLEDCNIPQDYLSYENSIKKYSLKCFEVDGNWFNAFIDGQKKILVTSPPLENKDIAFVSTFKRISLLYLFLKYIEKDIVKQNLSRPFTDIEIARYLNYDI